MIAMLKEKNYRDPHLLAMARGRMPVATLPGEPDSPETTVACHGNGPEFGKGKGLKAHDFFVIYAGANFHRWMDTGPAPREEKIAAFWCAYRHQLELWQSIIITHETTFQGKRKDYESAKNAIAAWRAWVARNSWRFYEGDWQLQWIKSVEVV